MSRRIDEKYYDSTNQWTDKNGGFCLRSESINKKLNKLIKRKKKNKD